MRTSRSGTYTLLMITLAFEMIFGVLAVLVVLAALIATGLWIFVPVIVVGALIWVAATAGAARTH